MTDEKPDGEGTRLREELAGVVLETFDAVSEIDV